jgi:hypothetical protein
MGTRGHRVSTRRVLAFPIVFFWRVDPANDFFREAFRTGLLPPDWTSWRVRWEIGHAAHLAAFVLLVFAPVRRRTAG